MPRTVEIRLGDKPYTVQQLRTRQASGWRKQVVEAFGEVVSPLLTVMDWKEVDLSDGQSVKALVDAIGPALLGAMDTVTDCLLAYAPELKGAIDEAYDDEIIDGFLGVLKLSVPFEAVSRLLSGSGSKTTPTSPSSPSASGGDGTTS